MSESERDDVMAAEDAVAGALEVKEDLEFHISTAIGKLADLGLSIQELSVAQLDSVITGETSTVVYPLSVAVTLTLRMVDGRSFCVGKLVKWLP